MVVGLVAVVAARVVRVVVVVRVVAVVMPGASEGRSMVKRGAGGVEVVGVVSSERRDAVVGMGDVSVSRHVLRTTWRDEARILSGLRVATVGREERAASGARMHAYVCMCVCMYVCM